MTRFPSDPRSKCSSSWCSPNIKLDIKECNGGNEAKKKHLLLPLQCSRICLSHLQALTSALFCPWLLQKLMGATHVVLIFSVVLLFLGEPPTSQFQEPSRILKTPLSDVYSLLTYSPSFRLMHTLVYHWPNTHVPWVLQSQDFPVCVS